MYREYIVEEEPDEDRPNGVTRRLIFLQNQNFIQTEIKMIEKKIINKNVQAKKGIKDKKKDKKLRKNDDDDNMEIDYGYFDDHHRLFKF
jgi:hypothetical protein